VTLMLSREALNSEPITMPAARIEIYLWGQVVPFVLAWALALMYRRRTPIHMRYMVSTIFAAGSAIVLRIEERLVDVVRAVVRNSAVIR
jgi:hypothetical protein